MDATDFFVEHLCELRLIVDNPQSKPWIRNKAKAEARRLCYHQGKPVPEWAS